MELDLDLVDLDELAGLESPGGLAGDPRVADGVVRVGAGTRRVDLHPEGRPRPPEPPVEVVVGGKRNQQSLCWNHLAAARVTLSLALVYLVFKIHTSKRFFFPQSQSFRRSPKRCFSLRFK